MGQTVMNHMARGGDTVLKIRRGGRQCFRAWIPHLCQLPPKPRSHHPRTFSDCPRGFSGSDCGWKCTDGGAGRVSRKQGVASGPDDQPGGQSLVLDRLALSPHWPLYATNRWRVDDTEKAQGQLRRLPQPHCCQRRAAPLRAALPLSVPARLGDPEAATP